MTDIDLLLRAATHIREHADNATRGDWAAGDDGLVWADPPIPGDPVSGSTQVPDARHIALWDPPTARLVASLLEAHARDLNTHGASVLGCDAAGRSIALARHILKEADHG